MCTTEDRTAVTVLFLAQTDLSLILESAQPWTLSIKRVKTSRPA